MHGWRISWAAILAACALAPVAAAEPGGIRQLDGVHLTLWTDLASDDEVDSLPAHFDQAFAGWCEYFGLDPAAHADWHVRGYLMRAPERFRAAGLLPAELPEFANAYSLHDVFWLHDQTSDYYRRHLVLHEGTHCFMNMLLGGTGPPWFAEGLAELLATHHLAGDRLTLGVFPRSADDVPKWGRIEIVQTDFAQRRAKTLAKVFALGGTLDAGNEAYGWSWAAAAFFDGHPRYRQRFRQLRTRVADKDFARHVAEAFAPDAARVHEDWQLFVANLDYGYDFERMEIDPLAGKPLAETSQTVAVAVDRGWQSSGVALEPGQTYRLRAAGRYLVAQGDEDLVSEPNGITIEYHQGQPLGTLLAAVRSDERGANNPTGLIRPLVVGLERTLTPERGGTLYLRVNDSAGRLDDNAGTLQVEIESVRGGS